MHFRRKISSVLIGVLLLVSTAFISSADFQQQAFLKASNPGEWDRFGVTSVSISGDTLVVGTIYEDSESTGVNGDEINNDATQAGAVYVFTQTAGIWSQQAYLKASNTEASDFFGFSVAISGDTLVVGAPYEDSNATDINGDESNNDATTSGAAYVFTRSAGLWSQQAYLKASNAEIGDFFGSTVAISGNKVLVGANIESSDATGVNGDENNNNSLASGAAYVFARSAGEWHQEAYLKASNTETNNHFGYDVAISGNTLVVGAYGEESASTGVNGDETNNAAAGSGAAYIFKYSAGSWQQQAYLKASNTGNNDWFGRAVDIAGNTVVIGAYGEDSDSSGVNADEANDDSLDAGAAYVFTRSLGVWSQQAYIKASNTDVGDIFGKTVAVSDNTIVIGAYSEDSHATGIDGDENNNDIFAAGAAYVFTRSAGIWSQQNYLKSAHPDISHYFGNNVAIDEYSVVISEENESSNVVGSGAAYVFNQPNSFGIRIDVTGLMSGGLVLQNNGADDLPILNNGSSQFDTPMTDGSSYQVSISSQPNNNNHTCLIEGSHAGVISAAPVIIKVRCADFIFVDGFE